jgi:transposase
MLPRHAITDAEWLRIQDLLPTRGPAADNRRFLDAVVYVGRTGIPWRDLPERFGPWNSAWRRFDRWSRAGVWQRVFDALQDPDLEWLILDSTIIRAHPCAAGAKKRRTGPGGRASRRWAAAGAGSGPRSTCG